MEVEVSPLLKLNELGKQSKLRVKMHLVGWNFTQRLILLFPLLAIGIWVFELRFRPWGWDLGHRAMIWALRLKF